jgi:hypothetical protein
VGPGFILAEAKYQSGTSDVVAPEEDDDYGRTGNQIADQVMAPSWSS